MRVAESDQVRAEIRSDGSGYDLYGTQRLIKESRLKEIADYINRVDSSFPNSIILAANYDSSTGFDRDESEYIDSDDEGIPTDKSKAWFVEKSEDGYYTLTIPAEKKLAAIIDGQHRLFAFAKAEIQARNSTDLLCSVYLDLPKALQAQIFATINSTQKRVDRSLTYELFGYNISSPVKIS